MDSENELSVPCVALLLFRSSPYRTYVQQQPETARSSAPRVFLGERFSRRGRKRDLGRFSSSVRLKLRKTELKEKVKVKVEHQN